MRGPHEADVVGCSGSFAGPGLAGQLLPASRPSRRRTEPHLADPARPRQRRARRAAAVRRPAQHRRGAASATCTPTTASTCAATTCCASTTPAAPAAADPGLGPGRHRRPDGARLRPARGPGDDRRVRLPRVRRAGRRSGRSRSSRCAVAHPVPAYGLRVDRRRPHARLHRRHRALRRRSTRWPTAPTCCWPRRRSATGDDNPRRPPPDRRRMRRGRRPQRRARGSWSPTSRRGTTPRDDARRGAQVFDGDGRRWPAPARRTTCSERP